MQRSRPACALTIFPRHSEALGVHLDVEDSSGDIQRKL
jgi:hypothetical protein